MTYCVPKTIANYKEHIKRFFKNCPAELSQLTDAHIKEYILRLRESGTRNVTVRCYLRSIKVFCSWLYENNYTKENLFARVKLPRSDAELKQPLTINEVKAIDDVLMLRDKIIVHLMLDAGLRASEVCALRNQDVDLINNVIYVHNSKYNKSRIIPLAPNLSKLIHYHTYRYTEFIVESRTKEQLNVNIIKLLFRRIKKQTGITRVHAHLCRHTFATSYIVGGGNMEKLRIMLGHSDYNVTQNYLHLAAQFEVVHYPIYQLDPVFFKTGY